MFPEVPVITVAERAQRAATSENTCKLRKHLPQFDNAHAANAQKRNALQIKCIWLWAFAACCVLLYLFVLWAFAVCFFICLCWEHLLCVSLFVCVGSICTICCQTDEDVFLIFWWFLYLHVFSEVAAFWALSATVPYGLLHCLFKKTDIHHTVEHCTFYIHYLSNVWGQ